MASTSAHRWLTVTTLIVGSLCFALLVCDARAGDCNAVIPCEDYFDGPAGECDTPDCNNVIPVYESPVRPPDGEAGGSCGVGGGLWWSGVGGGSGGSSGGGMMTPYPVNFAYGYKQIDANDLVVELPGRDFVVSRSYMSKVNTPGNWFGRNWQLNATVPIHRAYGTGSNSDTLRNSSHARGASVFRKSGSTWYPTGPNQQYIESTTLSIDIGESGGAQSYPVYKLIEPGQWVVYYGRYDSGSGLIGRNSWKDGAVFQVEDWYGNKKSYKYSDIGSGLVKWRLNTITCTPAGGGANDGAKIIFTWHATDHATHDLRGALSEIKVQRYTFESSSWAWRDVQKVEYGYKTGTADFLGGGRDLVQVTKSVKLDHGQWYVTVDQYRYHSGSTESADDDSDGFSAESGQAHQVKAIFAPEQIEYAAEQYNAGQSDANKKSLADYAAYLLTRDDGETAFGTTKVMALASSVIAKYETSGDYRVTEQYLQSACGCGGAAAQGLKLAYDYPASEHTSGDYARYLKVTETTHNGTDWSTARRIQYFDLKKVNVTLYDHADPTPDTTADIYLLGAETIQDGSSNEWVTRYTYDSDRRVSEVFTPSAHTNYTPGTSGGASASVTTNSNGLVHKLEYNSLDRVTRKSVRKVSDGTATTVQEWTYSATSGQEHLLTKTESFRVAGSSAANDKETVEYAYSFHSGTKIKWIETAVEAELEAENGPPSSIKYYSHEYFDSNGFNTWSRREDGSLTKRTFGDDDSGSANDNGKPTAVEENAAPASPITGESVPCGCSLAGRNADGGSLITEYTYDNLDRVRSVESPSGVMTRYAYELARDERKPHERTGFTKASAPFIEPYLVTVVLPHTFTESSTTKFDGAARVTIENAGGKVFESTSHSLSADSGSKYGDIFGSGYDFVLSATDLSRSTVQHHPNGLVQSQKVWHSIAGDGEGSGVYTTSYTYDALGRTSKVTAANGTVTKYTYDVLDRMISTLVGTDDTNPVIVSETFYDSGGTATAGIGNGTVGLVRQRMDDAGTNRDTKYMYDYRDRLLRIEPPHKPNTLMVYDNLDRVVEEAVFDDLPATTEDLTAADSNRGRYASTSYSQRGLVYKQAVAIDPTLVSGSRTYLETHTWYDEAGHPVGVWAPNSAATKTAYDGLGRVKAAHTGDRGGDDAPGASGNYADVYDTSTHVSVLASDVVIEQVNYRYIANEGLLDLVTTRQRAHRGINLGTALVTDSDTGALDGLASTKSIITYSGTYYDDADRVRHSADFGTNSSSGFISGTSAPTITQGSPPTGAELVTETVYDTRGRVDQSIDPEGMKTKFQYDDMDRRIAVIENYDNGAVSWNTTPSLDRWGASGLSTAALDQDRITSFVYDGAGNITQQVAHIPASGGSGETVQVTRYVYGVPKGTGAADSNLASNDLLHKVHYPNESTGEADTGADYTVTYAYNRQGELKYMLDQNLTVHEYTRDNVGRVTVDKATRDAGNGDLDNTVTALGTTYDDYGRVVLSRSYSTYNSGSPDSNVLNAVKFTYTKLWQIEKVWQEHSGNVDDDGSAPDSYKAQYVYSDAAVGSGNYSRVSSLTYPGSESLPYVYGATSGNSDDRISRLTKLNLSGQPVGYDYIGMGMAAIVDLETPDVQLDRYRSHLGESTSSPMTYPGFDRFGRIARQLWVDGNFVGTGGPPATNTNRPPIVDIAYTYDEASNRLTAKNENIAQSGWTNRDFAYTYDGLDRLKQADRGTAGGSFTHVANPAGGEFTPGQAWALDTLGNWNNLVTDKDADSADGNGTDNTEARTHNQANELLTQDLASAGAPDLDLTYDKAGNIRTQEAGVEATPTVITYTHDLWNRLVKVQYTPNGGSIATRAEYDYNALTWRIAKRADTNPTVSTALDQKRLMYYSANWQMLEERIDDDYQNSAGVNRRFQYIWGPRYIDDLVLRRLDATANGSFGDRSDLVYYHITDAQFSTVAILNHAGVLQERVSYDPYGRARQHPRYDCDGDGDVDSADSTVVTNSIGAAPGAGDVDRDGDVDATDANAVANNPSAAIPFGQLSTTDNVIGWDGYVFNSEIDEDGLYTVRHRHYRPATGRFIERDPLEYVSSPSLFELLLSNPATLQDPAGLDAGWARRPYVDPWGRDLPPRSPPYLVPNGQSLPDTAGDRLLQYLERICEERRDTEHCTVAQCKAEAKVIVDAYRQAIVNLRAQSQYQYCVDIAAEVQRQLHARGPFVCWGFDNVIGPGHNWVILGHRGDRCEAYQRPCLTLDPWHWYDAIPCVGGNPHGLDPDWYKDPFNGKPWMIPVHPTTPNHEFCPTRIDRPPSPPGPTPTPLLPGYCLLGETEVLTPSGYVRLDKLSIGDFVLSRDQFSGEDKISRVTAVRRHASAPVMQFTLVDSLGDTTTLVTTEEHPFWNARMGWTIARDFSIYDEMWSHDGVALVVTHVDRFCGWAQVYSLSVESPHNYFVTKSRIWTHNKPP